MWKHVKKCLPVKYCAIDQSGNVATLFTSFGLQRSGQHLIIDWLCRGFKDETIHFNHCRFIREKLRYTLTPVTGRRVIYGLDSIDDSGIQGRKNLIGSLPESLAPNLFYSIENISPNDYLYRKLLNKYRPIVVLILRDPANWLASSMRLRVHSHQRLKENKEILKEYLRLACSNHAKGQAPMNVNYNKFIEEYAYRCKLAEEFNAFDLDQAELALGKTPDFGGGSSFNGGRQTSTGTLDRWKEYERNEVFLSILDDVELLRLSVEYFGGLAGIRRIEEIVEPSRGSNG